MVCSRFKSHDYEEITRKGQIDMVERTADPRKLKMMPFRRERLVFFNYLFDLALAENAN
jgi:hypothetical protein